MMRWIGREIERQRDRDGRQTFERRKDSRERNVETASNTIKSCFDHCQNVFRNVN